MKILVGSTGFVGSNLAAAADFDGLYHASDVQAAYGTRPELLLYAGVRAAKFLANRDAEADWKQVCTALDNIHEIQPQRLVLISTVDVYPVPDGVDEDTPIELPDLAPYGRNRRRLELAVRELMPEALIVRLPALYGRNLKKNFLFDMIHLIPSMLTAAKYRELAASSSLIARSYELQANGFYACRAMDQAARARLKAEFQQAGFTAMAFTDSRAVFQFYGLHFLWGHIVKALQAELRLLNLATEPVSAAEVCRYVYGEDFVNEGAGKVPKYDFRTKHAALLGGQDGYVFSREQVLADIRKFVEAER